MIAAGKAAVKRQLVAALFHVRVAFHFPVNIARAGYTAAAAEGGFEKCLEYFKKNPGLVNFSGLSLIS